MPHGSRHGRTAALLAALLASAALGQGVDPEPAVPVQGPELVEPAQPADTATIAIIPAELLAQLDSPDVRSRERATAEVAGGAYTLAAIETALARTDLSLEQRSRLRTAARPVFERSPRAAIGIRFTGDRESTAVSPEEGFDAFNVLKDGDLIRAINGRRVSGQTDVRLSILSRDPGELITLEIVRNGEPRQVQLKLGSRAGFRSGPGMDNRISSDEIEDAWTRRSERLADQGARPLTAGISADRWRNAASIASHRPNAGGFDQPLVDPLTSEPIRSVLPRPEVPQIAMGGETRVRDDVDADALALGDPSRLIFNGPGRPRVTVRMQQWPAGQRDLIVAQVASLIQQRDDLVELLNQNNTQLSDPKNAGVRQQLLSQRQMLHGRISMLNTQIEQMQRLAEVVP